jgi:hypothetical protein
MDAYLAAAAALRTDSRADFVGPRPTWLIEAAEQKLRIRFPPTYRRFLLEFGCGNIGSQEIYGIADDDLDKGPIPNAVWLNERRRGQGWSSSCFVIHERGDGTSHALRFDQQPAGAVWLMDVVGNPIAKVSEDFGEFLLDLIMNS